MRKFKERYSKCAFCGRTLDPKKDDENYFHIVEIYDKSWDNMDYLYESDDDGTLLDGFEIGIMLCKCCHDQINDKPIILRWDHTPSEVYEDEK